MKLDELHSKLIAAARSNPPSDSVPYAFEKRIMAALKGSRALDAWALWSRSLWRAVAPCVALMLLLGAFSFFSSSANPPTTDLSQELENTLLAGVVQEQPGD